MAGFLLKKEGSSTPLKSLLNRFRDRAEPRSLSINDLSYDKK